MTRARRSARAVRRAFTLVELLVAITMLTLLLASASLVARRVLVVQATIAASSARASAIRDALGTLARHLDGAQPAAGDLRVARDTALEVQHAIGVLSACRMSGDTLVVGAASDSSAWGAVMPRSVTVDDVVRVWHDEAAAWSTHAVRAESAGGGVCGDSAAAWPARVTQRLVLVDTPAVRVGAPVRVLQRERWSLVRGGDGNWSLSLATWDAARAAFAAPQPLVSPLASPAARGGPGLDVVALDRGGAVLADSALARAVAVRVRMRAATQARAGDFTDSVRVHVGAR